MINKKMNLITWSVLAICITGSFSAMAQNQVVEGNWRGVFHIPNGTEVPFNFRVKGKTAADRKIYLLNGDESFQTSTPVQQADSLFIPFDQFDNELALKIDGNKLTGTFGKKDRTGKTIPVTAEYGQAFRFADDGEKPAADISGTYDINFKSNSGKEEKAVGLFKQHGGKLYATFMRITGDSRYLEGIVKGNQFFLSSFIGGGPAYYSGTFDASGQLTGSSGGMQFTGIKNNGAALPDPYQLTYLKDGYKTFDFSLPDADGHRISLKDEKFKNKVVILTIGGTWCPNCMDEAGFIAPWYQKNKSRGVEVVGVQFERKADPGYVKNAMENFKKRFGVTYTEVFGGIADKKIVAETFPALNTFLSFPTILFIDKKGNVAKIYTGFTGPATGAYYERFVKEFNDEVDSLLKS